MNNGAIVIVLLSLGMSSWAVVQLYSKHEALLWLRADMEKLKGRVQLLEANQRHDAMLIGNHRNPLEMTLEQWGAVMCAGCGMNVPTMDGFNPEAHDCDGIAHELIAT